MFKTSFIFNSNMKQFILKLTIFLVFFITAICALDYAISKGLYQMEDYRFQTWNAILNDTTNYDVIIMGNSRAEMHFSTRIIDNVLHCNSYNFGIGGYPINTQLFRYNLYRQAHKAPEIIIYQIDYATLQVMKSIKNQHQSEQFLPLVYDNYARKGLQDLGYSFIDTHIPLARYFGYQMVIKNGLLEFLGLKHYVNSSQKGFYPIAGEWDGSNLSQLKLREETFDTTAVHLFCDYLHQAQKENVKVILVNAPFYIEARKQITNYEELDSTIAAIAKQYDCVYLNYDKDYYLNTDTSNFTVSVHLNPAGADIFTKDFVEEVDSLLKIHF